MSKASNLIVNMMNPFRLFCLLAYYAFARYLPPSYFPLLGKPSKWLRYHICKHIFMKCGKNVNVERMAYFSSGCHLVIGDNSGIGVHAYLPSDIVIGSDVMMAPNCYVFAANHRFDKTDIPMSQQGNSPRRVTVIEDDVWIGRNVMMTPGRHIARGTIVAAGCVLTKDFPPYSIVGGNPSKFIRTRQRRQQ